MHAHTCVLFDYSYTRCMHTWHLKVFSFLFKTAQKRFLCHFLRVRWIQLMNYLMLKHFNASVEMTARQKGVKKIKQREIDFKKLL